MDELSKRTETLPERVKKLSIFIAIRKREITAYRAKIRALSDVGLIEKRKEVLMEAQNKAEEVLGAEAELGRLLDISNYRTYHEVRTGKFKKGKVLPKDISQKQSKEVQKINKTGLLLKAIWKKQDKKNR